MQNRRLFRGLFRNIPYMIKDKGWYNFRFDFDYSGGQYIEIKINGEPRDVINVFTDKSQSRVTTQKQFAFEVRQYVSRRRQINEMIEAYLMDQGVSNGNN